MTGMRPLSRLSAVGRGADQVEATSQAAEVHAQTPAEHLRHKDLACAGVPV